MADADLIRAHLKRGHEQAARGDWDGAITEWEKVLALQPGHTEALQLIEEGLGKRGDTDRTALPHDVDEEPSRRIVQVEIPGGADKTAADKTAPGLADDPWFADEVTNPESADETLRRLRRAEAEAAAFEKSGGRKGVVMGGAAGAPPGMTPVPEKPDRKRRTTVQSSIPAMIAHKDGRRTPVAAMPVVDEDAYEADDGVPEPANTDAVTRQIGSGGVSTPAHEVSDDDVIDEEEAVPPPLPDPALAAAARVRAGTLVDKCRAEFERRRVGDAATAALAALVEGEKAPPPGIAEVIQPARPLFERVFAAHVGPVSGIPVPAVGAAEIGGRTLDHRTGFLLSRMDGQVTVETLLEISGMGRFDTLRALSGLLHDGLIKFV